MCGAATGAARVPVQIVTFAVLRQTARLLKQTMKILLIQRQSLETYGFLYSDRQNCSESYEKQVRLVSATITYKLKHEANTRLAVKWRLSRSFLLSLTRWSGLCGDMHSLSPRTQRERMLRCCWELHQNEAQETVPQLDAPRQWLEDTYQLLIMAKHGKTTTVNNRVLNGHE